MTNSLQPLAVNLINANKAANKIPIFLIRKSASARGPGKLARRFRMIRIVNEITLDTGIRRHLFSLINQDGMIDAKTRVRGEKANEKLPARQSCIQTSVSLLLIPGALLKNHAGIADSEVAWPAMADLFLYKFPTCLAHFPQILVSRKNNSLIFRQWLCPRRSVCHSANAGSQRRII